MTKDNRTDSRLGFEKEAKYLTFSLAHEEYGIGILKVKEIIGKMPITPVPRVPSYVKGVINLRGKVIPVISLSLKFGMPEQEATERTCIIVVEVTTGKGLVLMGITVDSVSEVLSIKTADIEAPPSFGGPAVDTEYIVGMAKTATGVKILMDIDRVLGQQDVDMLAA
jgi:purine-binding chemotaxis protein CheW